MDDLENRVAKLEQKFDDFEKYQGKILEEFSDKVTELTDFFTSQIAIIKLGFDDYKKENRKFMMGIVGAVVVLIIAAVVKNFFP